MHKALVGNAVPALQSLLDNRALKLQLWVEHLCSASVQLRNLSKAVCKRG